MKPKTVSTRIYNKDLRKLVSYMHRHRLRTQAEAFSRIFRGFK